MKWVVHRSLWEIQTGIDIYLYSSQNLEQLFGFLVVSGLKIAVNVLQIADSILSLANLGLELLLNDSGLLFLAFILWVLNCRCHIELNILKTVLSSVGAF